VGSLSLALRNELDRNLPASMGTRLEDLMGASGAPSARAPGLAETNTSRSKAADPGQSVAGVEELRGTQRSAGGVP
jgi:hypothetical protein